MWECNFAGESMDYKLFWLRFAKKIWVVLTATILGALIIGVPYYLINVAFGDGPEYKIVSEYYLDYAEDNSGATYDYFNYYTWSEIADTDEFIAILSGLLPEDMFADEDTLRAYTDATVESDTRYLTTTVQTEHPDKTIAIARCMEEAVMVFAKGQKEFHSVRVVTAPLEAEKTYPDVRPVRALILGAILGLFVGLLRVCIALVCDDSVYLPRTLEKRYKIKALGCREMDESINNICYATKDTETVTLLCTGKVTEATCNEVLDYMKRGLKDDKCVQLVKDEVLSENFDFTKLRENGVVILLVEAGAKNGKRLERIIEQLNRQDVMIAGGFLLGEDKKLIKHYYG